MPSAGSAIYYYLTHLHELRALLQWRLRHGDIYPRNDSKVSHDARECWRLLALTSRSFVTVVQQLHPELLMPVCLFYLVLRALDTIEDDMTISIEEKVPLLRHFHTHIHDETWTFDGSGPDEKDREVLVKFDCVSREYNKIRDEYKAIIKDITEQMGNGMADFTIRADTTGVQAVKDYELYCHYVAGVVGHGVTRMFVLANFAEPTLLERPELIESMGQHLQQTNIIRDIREDHEQNRHFWPKEVWSKYVDNFSDLFLPQNREKALQCSSEMVLMAINRADECLMYIAAVHEQSVFNFVVIPQSMAIATLELCYQNPAIFERNVKITKGSACQLMIESTQNIRPVCEAFTRHAKKVQRKNNPSDPHYHDINAACEKIERSAESILSKHLQNPRTDKTLAVTSERKARKTVYWVLAVYATLGAIIAIVVRYA